MRCKVGREISNTDTGITSNWDQIETVSVTKTGLTIEADSRVFRFDSTGRLQTAYDGTYIYHRGFNNNIIRKRWETHVIQGKSVRHRDIESVCSVKRDQLLRTAYVTAHEFLPNVLDEDSLDTQLNKTVESVRNMSPESLQADKDQFHSIYEPISVLPPDQYKSVVLQAVTGCPYRCSFCSLYDETPYRIKTKSQFMEHCTAVREFFGRSRQSRSGVFLGDANPLAAPWETLQSNIRNISEIFPKISAKGIHAFLNCRTAANYPIQQLQWLHDHGLDRVYLGVESGSANVLSILNKPQTVSEIIEAIHKLKSVGYSIGLIILAGAGGRNLVENHHNQSVNLIEKLPLESKDIVYISPLKIEQESTYTSILQNQSNEHPSEREIHKLAMQLQTEIKPVTPARVVRYHVLESSYG